MTSTVHDVNVCCAKTTMPIVELVCLGGPKCLLPPSLLDAAHGIEPTGLRAGSQKRDLRNVEDSAEGLHWFGLGPGRGGIEQRGTLILGGDTFPLTP